MKHKVQSISILLGFQASKMQPGLSCYLSTTLKVHSQGEYNQIPYQIWALLVIKGNGGVPSVKLIGKFPTKHLTYWYTCTYKPIEDMAIGTYSYKYKAFDHCNTSLQQVRTVLPFICNSFVEGWSLVIFHTAILSLSCIQIWLYWLAFAWSLCIWIARHNTTS